MRSGRTLQILGGVLAGVLVVQAESVVGSAELPEVAGETEADTVEASIARQKGLLAAFGDHATLDWLMPFREKREQLFEDVGLEIAVSYHSLFQGSPQRGGVTSGAGDLTLGGRWALLGAERDVPLELHFRARHRHAFGSTAPAALGGTLGAAWGTTDGFSNGGFEVPDFYFKERFLEQNLELRIGQMVIDSQFDAHSLRGAKQSFLNQAFSANPAVAFPRFGAGATLHWKGEGGIDVTGGFSTVQGTQVGSQVDFDFGSGDFFQALQVGYDFAGWKGEDARWQALVWHADAVEEVGLPDGKGISLTLEQKLEDGRTRAFARYAHASGGATNIRNLIAMGMAKDSREADLFGMAVGVGQASVGGQDWQTAVEWFYRWQVGPQFHVTPDVQMLLGDDMTGGGDWRLIFGLRGALTF